VRMELGEIEWAAMRAEGVQDAAVGLTKGALPSLVCFVVPQPDRAPDLAVLGRQLGEWLPESATPTRLQLVPAIPLTPSGKKDRARLIAEFGQRAVQHAEEYLPPGTETESQLAILWQEVLRL